MEITSICLSPCHTHSQARIDLQETLGKDATNWIVE